MDGSQSEDIEIASATEAMKGRMGFAFFVERHAGAVRTLAGTACRADVTAYPCRINDAAGFQLIGRQLINVFNCLVGNLLEVLFFVQIAGCAVGLSRFGFVGYRRGFISLILHMDTSLTTEAWCWCVGNEGSL